MLGRIFRLREHGTTARTELVAGLMTFVAFSYIIFVQPAVLSGAMTGQPTGMDFGAVTTAACLAAALASTVMGLYGRYPIAQAPGMGENCFFAFTAIPVAAADHRAGARDRRHSAFLFDSGRPRARVHCLSAGDADRRPHGRGTAGVVAGRGIVARVFPGPASRALTNRIARRRLQGLGCASARWTADRARGAIAV